MKGAALLILCLASHAASGKPAPDPCDSKTRDDTACYVRRQKDVLAAYGLESAAARLAAGTEMRRALFVDDYGRNVVAVEFARTPGQSPRLRVYRPLAQGGARPALEAETGAALWEEVLDRGAHFHRALAPKPRPNQRDGDIVICLHAWFYIAEATDPDAGETELKLRQGAEDGCHDGLVEDYAQFLAEAAVRALPPCQPLDREHESHAGILAACSMFEGDRIAAAQAYAAMESVGAFRFPTARGDAAGIGHLFADPVQFGWDGAAVALGSKAAAERWVAEMIEPHSSFWPERVLGERADRVRIFGYLLRYTDVEGDPQAEPLTWRAPVEQTWARGDYDDFRLEKLEVGAFERVAD